MHCGYADDSWEFWVSILVFMFLKYVIFCVYPWCDLLWYIFFFIFQDIVWLVKSSWCVKCCSTHQVYWVSVWCSSGFALWCFFVRKVVTVLAVFLSFWSWLPDIPWVFINLKAELSFWGRNCLLTCLCYLGLSNFWFQFSLCGIMSFYVSMCLSVMRFSREKFFHYLNTVSGWYYQFNVLFFFI